MNKICHHCKKESVPGKSFCEKHLENKRVAAAKRREQARDLGMCRSCCAHPAEPGTSRCTRCRARNAIAMKRDRENLKIKGICNVCRKNPVMPGRTRCGACTQFGYDDTEKHRGKAYIRDKGICQICGSGGYVYVHHKDGSGEDGKASNHDLDNLITLCSSCHVNVHKLARRLYHIQYMPKILDLAIQLLG